jgi:hypothetical protein
MNWRRGLLLAGINLAVAVPLILTLEAEEATALQQRESAETEAEREAVSRPQQPAVSPKRDEARTAEESVPINSCAMLVHYPIQTTVEQAATYTSLVFNVWRTECPAKWSIAAKLHADAIWVPTVAAHTALNASLRRADRIFFVILPVQWFLIGMFPLVHPRYWWAEPGMFITLCIAIAGVFALIPVITGFAQLPAFIAMLAWLLWFFLLLFKAVRPAWQSTLPGFRRLSN